MISSCKIVLSGSVSFTSNQPRLHNIARKSPMRTRNATHQPSFSRHADRSAIVKPLKTKLGQKGPTTGGFEMKPRVSTAGLAILLLSVAVLPGIFFFTQILTEKNTAHVSTGPHTAALPTNKPFDYILI